MVILMEYHEWQSVWAPYSHIYGEYTQIKYGMSIVSFSSTQILVRVGCGNILVQGEKLKIKKYCIGDLVILGKITLVAKND